jgi:hypothetical protein
MPWHANQTSFKKGRTSFNKGKKLTEEHKKAISNAQKGEKAFWYGKKTWNYGKPYTQIQGSKHWNWKGGSPRRTNTFEWDVIRKEVYKRDGWVCQVCGKKPKILQCHHIVPYRISQDDSIENLITLCCSCHTKEEHKYYRRLQNGVYKQG